MKQTENKIRLKIEQLRTEVEDFVNFFQQRLDYDQMVYELWNANDMLGHITFRHESFASNIFDLGNGKTPRPIKGPLSEVNILSVETTKNVSIPKFIERLKSAQIVIEKFIFIKSIKHIPYKKGSRDYSREKHLEIVSSHKIQKKRQLKPNDVLPQQYCLIILSRK